MIDLKQWVVWTLRKASYRWPPRQQALARSKVQIGKGSFMARKFPRCRNFYQCAECEDVFVRKGVSIDHIEPVVDPRKGWQGFDVYIKRMFCGVEGFQVLCSACHDAKTAKENKVRKKHKAERKVS